MTWTGEGLRNKIVTLNLKYAEADLERMKVIKDLKGMNWEDFFFYAAVNIQIKKKKEVKK